MLSITNPETSAKQKSQCDHRWPAVLLTDLSNSCHYFPKSQTKNTFRRLSRKSRKLFMKQVCAVLQMIPITVQQAEHLVFSCGLAMQVDEKSIREQRNIPALPAPLFPVTIPISQSLYY